MYDKVMGTKNPAGGGTDCTSPAGMYVGECQSALKVTLTGRSVDDEPIRALYVPGR